MRPSPLASTRSTKAAVSSDVTARPNRRSDSSSSPAVMNPSPSLSKVEKIRSSSCSPSSTDEAPSSSSSSSASGFFTSPGDAADGRSEESHGRSLGRPRKRR
ncbi:hypothetical protein ZIOFF_016710 [Zingiber officinale]|uniref:Uncharacterized protein n=1 Tax=Zingiber officinale TaxID=94328 RepID=A0A8J5LVK1_ZINOF|nr:hypothetical protein ZIOFF_016710 [Zingiber officinale]